MAALSRKCSKTYPLEIKGNPCFSATNQTCLLAASYTNTDKSLSKNLAQAFGFYLGMRGIDSLAAQESPPMSFFSLCY